MAKVYMQQEIPAKLVEVLELLHKTAPTKFGMTKDIVEAWLTQADANVAARDAALDRVIAVLKEAAHG